MGRYTQRRRAASQGVASSPATIVSVVAGAANHTIVTFDRPVTLVTGATSSGLFQVDGSSPTSVAIQSATAANLTFPSSFSPGDPWSLTGQPAWLTTRAAFPASGLYA